MQNAKSFSQNNRVNKKKLLFTMVVEHLKPHNFSSLDSVLVFRCRTIHNMKAKWYSWGINFPTLFFLLVTFFYLKERVLPEWWRKLLILKVLNEMSTQNRERKEKKTFRPEKILGESFTRNGKFFFIFFCCCCFFSL